jgi:DNA end-binding protein Ku
LLALEPRELGILTYTLRSNREVRNPEEAFGAIPDQKPNPQMVEIATKIIDQLEGPFDPAQFTDRYEDALRELIREKEKGAPVSAPEQPKEAQVIDLMEALKRSLGQPGAGERRKPAPRTGSAGKGGARKPAPRKAPAKKRA